MPGVVRPWHYSSMANDSRPEDLRRSDGLAFMTSDSPSGYLVESEIAMLGRLGRSDDPARRFYGKIAAVILLLVMAIPIFFLLLTILRS